MNRREVIERLLEAFDGDVDPFRWNDFLQFYSRIRWGIIWNIENTLTKKDAPVTRGLLWQVRKVLDDMQSVMIGNGNDDPDLDKRFADMRRCIDKELSVEAPPSPPVTEIWSRRFHALLDFCLRRKRPILMADGQVNRSKLP